MLNLKEKRYHFERLIPINDDDLNVYEEAKTPYLIILTKNVAISGEYSAGKI